MINSERIEGFPLLRDQVDDPAILALFQDDSDGIRAAVHHLLARAEDDEYLLDELVDALESSIEECIDDTDATLWIIVTLGELGARQAIGALLRTFALDDDALQNSCGVALLRIGAPALEALMEWLDEDPGQDLRRAGYRLIGDSAVIDNGSFVQQAREFLRDRLSRERLFDATESSLDEAVLASARLGDHEQLGTFQEILRRDFDGQRPAVQDAIEQLAENPDGVPFVPTRPPWVEQYGWLFDEDELERSQSRRHGPAFLDEPEPPDEMPDEGLSSTTLHVQGDAPEDQRDVKIAGIDAESELSCYYWGLGATAETRSEPQDGGQPRQLDARNSIQKPRPSPENESGRESED